MEALDLFGNRMVQQNSSNIQKIVSYIVSAMTCLTTMISIPSSKLHNINNGSVIQIIHLNWQGEISVNLNWLDEISVHLN